MRASYDAFASQDGDGLDNLKCRASSWGYDDEFLSSLGIPLGDDAAALFRGACGGGCPLRLPGSPRPGESVLDLGCGFGHDVVLASRMVGRRGRVIGVDCTPGMLDAAAGNCARYDCEAPHPAPPRRHPDCLLCPRPRRSPMCRRSR